MTVKLDHAILVILAGVALCSCGETAPDYSKVQAQTGGPEQGTWQDKQGTTLILNSGKFTYSKDGGQQIKGDYKVNGSQIVLTSDIGQAMSAQWPGTGSPVSIDGESLVKTD